MFSGFESTGIRDRRSLAFSFGAQSAGPPLLLLHGFPQTHAMMVEGSAIAGRRISPSSVPTCAAMVSVLARHPRLDHAPYSKRAMASDMVAVIEQLGFLAFVSPVTDRGGRVAYRLALDQPDAMCRTARCSGYSPDSRCLGPSGREVRPRSFTHIESALRGRPRIPNQCRSGRRLAIRQCEETEHGALDETAFVGRGGYAIQLDNDLFLRRTSPIRTTAGVVVVTYASPNPGPVMRPLISTRSTGFAVAWGSRPTRSQIRAASTPRQATQIGILFSPAMTPGSLPKSDERRSSAIVSFARPAVHADELGNFVCFEGGDRARFSSFRFGIAWLACRPKVLHRGVRQLVGDERPRGWEHQISAGGEPTARYVESQQWLLNDVQTHTAGLPGLKVTLAGNAGYITEDERCAFHAMGTHSVTVVELFARAGQLRLRAARAGEHLQWTQSADVFALTSFRLKARAYHNALLQGQFRHSDVRVQGRRSRAPAGRRVAGYGDHLVGCAHHPRAALCLGGDDYRAQPARPHLGGHQLPGFDL